MKGIDMEIREALPSDVEEVLAVERVAFGEEDEANLVQDLLGDPSAKPTLSLIAVEGDKVVGHILFTKATLVPDAGISISLLCPLAIIPDAQNKGIGGALIKHGLEMLSQSGVDLVFVLGHPGYYPRHGFNPAGVQGFEAPYPILEKNAGAWMVQALSKDIIGKLSGTVICADIVSKPEYWLE